MCPKIKDDVPIIYALFYTHIKEGWKERYIPQKLVFIALRKTIYRLPKSIYYQILREMEGLELIKRISQSRFQILDMPDCDKKIEKLKDYLFW